MNNSFHSECDTIEWSFVLLTSINAFFSSTLAELHEHEHRFSLFLYSWGEQRDVAAKRSERTMVSKWMENEKKAVENEDEKLRWPQHGILMWRASYIIDWNFYW